MKIYRFVIWSFLVTTVIGQTVRDFDQQPKLAWQFKTTGAVISSPVIDGNTVYVASLDSGLYAIDLSTGKAKWTFGTFGSIRSTVCIEQNQLFLLGGDTYLYCLNKNTGAELWRFRTFNGYMGDRRYDWADYYHSSPVISNGIVYFGSGNTLYAVKISTGDIVWYYQTGDVVHTVPSVYKEKIFVGSFDGHVYALNNLTGQLIWKFKTTGQRYFPRGEVMGSPVAHGGYVFVGARDFNFYALDANGGYSRWLKTFPKGWALPVTPNDSVIYVGTSDDRLLVAMDFQTGDTVWTANAKFNIFGKMTRSQSMGYFGTLMGKIFGIDLKTGKIKWSLNTEGYNNHRLKYLKDDDNYRDDIGAILGTGNDALQMYYNLGAIFSTPAITNEYIVVSSADGSVYGYSR